MIQSLAVLLTIFILPGYAIWTVAGQELRGRVSSIEAFFLVILTSVIVVSWPAMILAEIGRFSLTLLLILVLGSSLVLLGWASRRSQITSPFHGTFPDLAGTLAFAVLVVSFLVSPRPSEYIVGGRDHGIYVNTGIYISRKGSILLKDPELAAVPAESRSALVSPEVTTAHTLLPGPWSQGRHIPGTTIRNLEEGILAPHAYHLYPVWIAIFHSTGGLPFALATTTVFSFLGAFAIYLSGARLLGRPVALLALVLLIFNITQNWFSRYPSAEIVVRFLFWSGILAAILMFSARSRYAAIIAGSSLGLMHLAKLDTIFVPILLTGFFLYQWFNGRLRPIHGYLIVSYLLILIHAFIHGFFISTVYTLDQVTRVLLPEFLAQRVIHAASGFTDPADILGRLLVQNLGLISATLTVSLVTAFTVVRFREPVGRRMKRIARHGSWVRGLLMVTLGIAFVASYYSPSHLNMTWLVEPALSLELTSWYLSPLGMALGMVGLLQVITRNPESEQSVANNLSWLLIIGSMLPLYIWGTGAYPDHFWAIRRFITVVFPGAILLISYTIWQLVPSRAKSWPKGLLPLALTIMLVGSFWNITQPLWRVIEYDGLAKEINELNQRFPEDAVLLIERSDPAGRVAAPLWYIHNRTIFYVNGESLNTPAVEAAIAFWDASGREVFWISSDKKPPVFVKHLVSYERTEEFSTPLVETPVRRLPERIGRYRVTLDVFQIIADSQTSDFRQVVTVDFASGKNDEFIRKGLYDVERLPGLTPRRWTSGKVVMEILNSSRPQELLLSMASGWPAGIPSPEVTVKLDRHVLGTVSVGSETTVYTFQIPEGVPIEDDVIEMRLEMKPWVPSETGHSKDIRPLGVQLNWMKLVVEQPAEIGS